MKRYKDGLKATLQACSIDPSIWEDAALDRPARREMCFRGVSGFEYHGVENLAVKRQKRKTGQYSMTGTLYATSADGDVGHALDCTRTCVHMGADHLIRFRRKNPSIPGIIQ